ncbi:hydroxypyruvate isomerase family protein [Pseudomaricurvus sp. HS19]|uniref:hydroxypyruvate isomerase family protein n=1 Tax=Pseudomaricurvus sp. HS19 TaxID=2692626 RepID=UPI001371762B|nr:TIM barrel protein [Pseudomaricurvus sp. HS19]MYM62081.1 TIM barrel protein [Pseudomaricurvus sp. HS19]
MKFSANLSLLFTEHPMEDRFAASRSCGFEAVEIQFPYALEPRQIADQLQQFNQQLILINVPAGDLMSGGAGLASHPKRRDEFKRAVELCAHYAEQLQVPQVNVLAGRETDDYPPEAHYDQLLHNLDYCAGQLGSLGITTLFEGINTFDMPGFLIHNAEQMQQVIHDLNHPRVAMQFDLYHMARMQQPMESLIPELCRHFGHVQFADTPDRHQPGSGELPWQRLFALLEECGYEGWLGAEYTPSGHTEDSLGWLAEFRQ